MAKFAMCEMYITQSEAYTNTFTQKCWKLE